jgi:hypothetical protein
MQPLVSHAPLCKTCVRCTCFTSPLIDEWISVGRDDDGNKRAINEWPVRAAQERVIVVFTTDDVLFRASDGREAGLRFDGVANLARNIIPAIVCAVQPGRREPGVR